MTQKPPKYIGLTINDAYVQFLELQFEHLKGTVALVEAWSDDQENGMYTGDICIAAMKDVRRLVNKI
jgi:hypothetical protein|tara:strand:+ start:1748 stop:1948 length:201 start_codon:yes stop_codon:yes gene_type:complete